MISPSLFLPTPHPLPPSVPPLGSLTPTFPPIPSVHLPARSRRTAAHSPHRACGAEHRDRTAACPGAQPVTRPGGSARRCSSSRRPQRRLGCRVSTRTHRSDRAPDAARRLRAPRAFRGGRLAAPRRPPPCRVCARRRARRLLHIVAATALRFLADFPKKL